MINNQTSTLVELYNSAYNSYLSKIYPNIFLHTLLNDVVRMANGQCGVVMGYDSDTHILNLITHISNEPFTEGSEATNNMETEVNASTKNNLWLTFSNYIRNHQILNKTSLIMRNIDNKKVDIKNFCTVSEILGVESVLSQQDETGSSKHIINTIDPTNSDIKRSVMFLPFVMNDMANGIMMICGDNVCMEQNNHSLQSEFNSFCTMMGVLFNNISILPLHIENDYRCVIDPLPIKGMDQTTENCQPVSDSQKNMNDNFQPMYDKPNTGRSVFNNIDHSITYQLVHDTLNIVADIIVITDRDMRIIYKNENFITLVKNKYPDKIVYTQCNNSVIKNNHILPDYLIDIIPQSISLIATSIDQHTTSFYRNKKLEIDVKNSDSILEIHVNSTVSCGGTYHILRIHDKDVSKDNVKDTNDKMYNNSKNLIAYLSHELRNPIQAISTGVYIIDRTIKNIDIVVRAKKKKPLKSISSDNELRVICSMDPESLSESQSQSTDVEYSPITSPKDSPSDSPKDSVGEKYISKLVINMKKTNTNKRSNTKQHSPKPNKRSYIDTQTDDMCKNDYDHDEIHNIMSKSVSDIDPVFSFHDTENKKDVLVINDCNHKNINECTKACIAICAVDSVFDRLLDIPKSTYGSIDSLSDSHIFADDMSGLDSSEISVGSSVDSIDDINLDSDEISTLRCVIKRVFSACKNMNIIIDDILDLSKIDNDELIMNLDEHNLQEITDLIIEESESEAAKKGLQLEYEFDAKNPEFIYTDSTRIFQILSNLISNSIKYSNTGVIKFKVTYDSDNNNVIFQVTDQGRGIRNEEICNLFKQFGRTSNSVTDINSTGLGLCVCQKIANLLGGSIEVTSEHKKGSTFTFVHPIKLGYSGSGLEPEQDSDKCIKGNILIVDDDPNITSLFKLLLRCMNYDRGYDLMIETAGTGDKAIHLAKTKKYGLIFMDIDLDGEDGCTVCEQIHTDCELNANSPIVAVTANIKSVQRDRDLKFDIFNDVILKPFNNRDINNIIVKYLNR
jgi:signal transduction histidine kinase/CheY-like chemotaxis protein